VKKWNVEGSRASAIVASLKMEGAARSGCTWSCLWYLSGCGKINRWTLHTVGTRTTTLS
jgi:hypothetical protein